MKKDYYIEQYVLKKVKKLKRKNIYVNSNRVEEIIKKYSTNSISYVNVWKDIDKEFKRLLDEYYEIKKLREAYMDKIEENKDLEDLPLEYSGITLNHQDIDLMMIEDAKTPEELNETLENVSNSKLTNPKLSDKQFLQVKKESFELYQSTLIDKNDYLKNNNIALMKRLNYLKDSGELTEEEKDAFDEVLSSTSDKDELPEKIISTFGEEKAKKIFDTLKECDPVEKTGIKNINMESTHRLLDKVKNSYDSITLDEDCKYGNVVSYDGSFYYDRINTSLNFIRGLGKEVRLNTLMFYMDCPDSLYNLEKNDDNKKIVKDKLTDYVISTTSFIKDNDYEDTVRSIDVFNELLNRFPMKGNEPYKYRGDIDQTNVTDNTKAGWFKHLDLNDVCDVISEGRKNLPNTDFMYNDDNLTDPKKLEATDKIISQIRNYEKNNNITILDSIGTQMHLDNNVTKEEIENMFRHLSTYGLPIEITEFDLAMTHNVEGLSDKEIEDLRQDKINEIYECISNLSDECNIRGCTIWSKTDAQNFRVSLKNEELINEGKEPIETLHGGYFTNDMESKVVNEEKSLEEINQLVKDEPYRDFNYHTHTYRCGHASNNDDKEYIEAAKSVGITTLGFSDHVPYTDLEKPDEGQRMDISQVDEYVESIHNLQDENPDMTILSGFEVEYDPAKKKFFAELRDKVDYLILGQHFVFNDENRKLVKKKGNPNYPLSYAKAICDAIDTGLFDIIAHPDTYMELFGTMITDEDKDLFLENADIANKMICEKAKEYNIPLELNLAGDKEKGMPDPGFWLVASEYQNEVISGADAHYPEQLVSMAKNEIEKEELINNISLNKVSIDYNPKERRKVNSKLLEAEDKTRKESLSYEAYLASSMINIILNKNNDDVSKLPTTLKNMALNETVDKKIEELNNDNRLSPEEKATKLAKIIKEIKSPRYMSALDKRKALFEKIANIVIIAIEKGIKSKGELISYVIDSLENNITNTNTNINDNELNDMLELSEEKEEEIVQTKSDNNKVYQKLDTNKVNEDGFVSTLSLGAILIVLFNIIVVLVAIILKVK